MCNNEKLFVEFRSLKKPLEVTLGDGFTLEATGRGIVPFEMKLPNCKIVSCKVQDVLFVPKLAYNMISVSKAAEAGKTTKFDESGCRILDGRKKLIAVATRVGSLYYLDCHSDSQQLNAIEKQSQEMKKNV